MYQGSISLSIYLYLNMFYFKLVCFAYSYFILLKKMH